MFCDDLEWWDEGWAGRENQEEGTCVYIQLIHAVVQQKLAQHFKAIIVQFFKNALV